MRRISRIRHEYTCGRTRHGRLLCDKRYRHLASDTYIATLSLLSVDYPVDDARVLEAARERDSCRRQAFTISHSFASSLTYEYIVLLYRQHFYQLITLLTDHVFSTISKFHSVHFVLIITHGWFTIVLFTNTRPAFLTCFEFPLVKKAYRQECA